MTRRKRQWETKRLVQGYVRDLAAAAGAQAPDELSTHLVLLLEGATVMAQVTGNRETARQARKAATLLVQAALGTPHKGSSSSAV